MKAVMSVAKIAVALVILGVIGTLTVVYYPWLFGKTVDGEIMEVERVTMPDMVVGSVNKFQMHSYAVLIKDKTGEMYTSSSEDRRWQVAKKGMCVVSLFYRHPPWRLQSAGAFYNARVKRIYDCPEKEKTSPAPNDSKAPEVPEKSAPSAPSEP